MRRILIKVASLSLATLLGVISLGVHASALSQQSSHGMNHGANSTSSSCVTICNFNTQYKTEFTDEVKEDDDDNATEPYYLQFRTSPLDGLIEDHNQRARVANNLEPPPGMPAYIALAVFRA